MTIRSGDDDGTLTCERVRALVMERQDGELDRRECAAVERHLGACPPCRAMDDAERERRGAVRRVCSERAPETLRERIAAWLRG